MASNSERIQEHTSRIEDVVNQIITAGGFVFVDTDQNIKGLKTFSEMVGISNINGTTDYLKHINNNFLISTSTGTNLLNIDEGLNKIYAFNKELAFKDDIGESTGGITEEKLEEKLTDYVQFTDIAAKEKAGVVYLQNGVFGIGHNAVAGLYVTQATDPDITRKTNQYCAITPKNLDYAVKTSVTTNAIELTDEEKAQAQNWIGATNTEYVDNKFNGANKAVSFMNYSSMISSLNDLPSTSYSVGQNVMVVTLEVPDLWVSEIAETSIPYTYVSDNDFVSALNTNGSVQVGYYKLSALETQKVDLTNYVKNTDVAGNLQLGLIAGGENYYGFIVTPGTGLPRAISLDVDRYNSIRAENKNFYWFISNGTLENIKDDYVKRGLTENAIEFTDEEKVSARTLIDAVGSTDYATASKAGVVRVAGGDYGVEMRSDGIAQLRYASENDILKKDKYRYVISPKNLDFAVKTSITTNTIELSNEEKAAAQNWLGITGVTFRRWS